MVLEAAQVVQERQIPAAEAVVRLIIQAVVQEDQVL